MKTTGQVMDEINQMNDGSIMEIYKVKGGFKTKFQSGWVPAPADDLCHKCGGIMKFTGIAKLSSPPQNEYRCEKCKHIEYKIETTSRELIEERKPLFVTEDGVDIFDLCQTVYLIHPKTFIKQKSVLGYFSTNDLDNNKLFFHESNADEYIWKNKPLFSYEDFIRWGNVPYERVIMKLAKERVEK